MTLQAPVLTPSRSVPPPPTLFVEFNGTKFPVQAGSPFVVGRSGNVSLAINSPTVSRRHLAVGFKHGWFVEDLGSSNGTFVGARRIERESVVGPLTLRLGEAPTGPTITLLPDRESVDTALEVLELTSSAAFRRTNRDRLSRALAEADAPPLLAAPELMAGAAAPPAAPAVQPQWATLLRHAEAPPLLHGAAAFAMPLTGLPGAPAPANQQSPSAIPPYPGPRLSPTMPWTGTDGLQIRGLGFTVEGGKQLLRDISFNAPRGTLTAIVGPSGAGKSTFAKAVSGLTKPTAGTVRFDGVDVHEHYARAKSLIGMVPQEDVIHGQLTLIRALRYAAKLRLGASTTRAERARQVNRVLEQLDLEMHVNTRISKLSGGQRKRASVALELLLEPSFLILDEPTSGLDPALDRQLMVEFRGLADGGRSVLAITHSVACLDMCDQILVLVPGGAPAFIGSEDEAWEHFGTSDWSQIFELLKDDPEGCAARWVATSEARRLAYEPPLMASPETITPTPTASPARQFSTLIRRQVSLMLADHGYTLFLLALPFVIGLLPLVVPGETGLTQVQQAKNAQEPQMILTLLTIGAIFMGISMSIRDLVGERTIFERERAVGLSTAAYLAAKVVVYNTVGLFGAIIIVWISGIVKEPPTGDGVLGFGARVELVIALAATIWIGVLLGLLLSALVSSQNQVMPVLIVVLMLQMVLNGGLIPLIDNALLNGISYAMPARWSFSLGAVSLDLHHLSEIADEAERMAAEASLPELDPMWNPSVARWGLAATVLVAMSALMLGIAGWRTRTRGR